MKIFSKVISIILTLIFIGFSTQVSAGWLSDLNETSSPTINYCQWDDDCGIEKGLEVVKDNLDGVETEVALSQYIQNIVVYLIWFLSIIAVIYIIYAGFNILTGTGDEEKIKKSKSTITYVIAWLIVIYLSYSIVAFIFDVFDQASYAEETALTEYKVSI